MFGGDQHVFYKDGIFYQDGVFHQDGVFYGCNDRGADSAVGLYNYA
jgi:hypothetical protein